MFGSIEIPFGSVMLFNVVKLKAGVEVDDVELAVGEMCNTVKNNYGDENGGFIAGQVFKYAGFISDGGSVGEAGEEGEENKFKAKFRIGRVGSGREGSWPCTTEHAGRGVTN